MNAHRTRRTNRAQPLKTNVKSSSGSPFRFEDQVSARFLLDMLGGTNTLGAEKFGAIVKVDRQVRDQGWLADDLAVTCNSPSGGRCAAISIKSGQRVTATMGFPSEFIDLAWSQWFGGDGLRDIRTGNDVVALVTGKGGQGPRTDWNDLLSQTLDAAPDRIGPRLAEGSGQASNAKRAIFVSVKTPPLYLSRKISDEDTARLLAKI